VGQFTSIEGGSLFRYGCFGRTMNRRNGGIGNGFGNSSLVKSAEGKLLRRLNFTLGVHRDSRVAGWGVGKRGDKPGPLSRS